MIKPQIKIQRDPMSEDKIAILKKRVKSRGVEVGVLTGTGEHPNATGGQTIAEIAVWNEFGTRRAPARPFLRSTMRLERRAYKKLVRTLLKRLLAGHVSIKQATAELGMKAQSDVRNIITVLSRPANKESTKTKKKSSNPLVDSGELRLSINWKEVRM